MIAGTRSFGACEMLSGEAGFGSIAEGAPPEQPARTAIAAAALSVLNGVKFVI
jgi:hypothetical protein